MLLPCRPERVYESRDLMLLIFLRDPSTSLHRVERDSVPLRTTQNGAFLLYLPLNDVFLLFSYLAARVA